MTQPPAKPKLYHIVHVDRLPSILAAGHVFCDAVMVQRKECGTTIGMNKIKQRRLQIELDCHPGLHVGECVPFYLCPRSVMPRSKSGKRGRHPD
jgi:ssDNA thymidine ADP-ribosyltransferase, DarT